MVLSVGLSLWQVKRLGCDQEMIQACRAIIAKVGENTTVHICAEMFPIWSLHGYMARYGQVSLDTDLSKDHTYFFTTAGCGSLQSNEQYEQVDIKSELYQPYKCQKY